jgi:hypothetical protein
VSARTEPLDLIARLHRYALQRDNPSGAKARDTAIDTWRHYVLGDRYMAREFTPAQMRRAKHKANRAMALARLAKHINEGGEA